MDVSNMTFNLRRVCFLRNRFLICKHLAQAVDGASKRLLCNEIHRNREYPFWQFGDLNDPEKANFNFNITIQ
jgi:hypothetical protein